MLIQLNYAKTGNRVTKDDVTLCMKFEDSMYNTFYLNFEEIN